ncbi:baculoviral IAP repeat-containing protein 6-like [Ctenocephalides felis]|uniref:baculoviral IAP repeat-containing protein 6-like n=1 Tax=Ctenocephalides felis TaxID=7515 RepID=UPI000E6E3BED|nr:baculoviral IAP repeat-containing protein 6-like [Ctenocephalides felis]
MYAINRCVKYIDEHNVKKSVIISDSRSALEGMLSLGKDPSLLTIDTLNDIHAILSKNWELRIVWVRSHIGIAGNEAADNGAKDAINTGTVAADGISYRDIKRFNRANIRNIWQLDFQLSIRIKGKFYGMIQGKIPVKPCGVSDLPPDAPIVPFDQTLLRVLLKTMLNGLPQVKTASALRWYCLLLIRFAGAENRGPLAVVERCLRLLRKAAIERSKRRCPYTDLLRARFGLNGMPFDSDVFDGELPQQIQQRGLDSMLGNRKPKAVSDLADMAAKPIPCTKGLRGLGEVQPLHFICNSASEGTKLERLQNSGTNTCFNFDGTHNILFKQFDPKDVKEDQILESSALSMNCKLGKLLLSVEKELAKAKSTLGHKDIDMEVSDYQPDVDVAEDMSVDADDTKSNTFSQYLQHMSQLDTTQSWSPASQATTIGSQNTDYSQNGDEYILPWSRLLTPPGQQAIVIARMHSCARRFVILDFGRPVLLTDLAIPSCNELMSLTLDYWITSEDGESIRLVMASDIGTRTLVMKDLQPAPVLRFLKLTMIGRYGMTATSVKLSAGRYYGHSTVLEADAYCESPAGLSSTSVVTTSERARTQLASLNSLYEDTACRYRSACCNLRSILRPLMGLAPSLAEKCADGEDDKVMMAYQECISLQQQLSVLQSVTLRLQEACNEQSTEQQIIKTEEYISHNAISSSEFDLAAASSDKLRVLCESLVVVYLRLLQKASPKMACNLARFIDQEACSELFSTLVVHGDSAQISCCALLSTACSNRTWWGTFLADSLKTLYSSSCTQLFPKERVFLLLTHLGRRGNPRSRVLDAALLALLQLLAPIAPINQSAAGARADQHQQVHEDELSPLSAKIDLSLLSWFLLYLSASLDDGKEVNSSRWEFMSGQTCTQRTRSESERNQERTGATRVYRRKLQKRLMHHKIQLDDLESAKKAFQASSQAFSNLSSQASNLSAKLDAALKQQENVLKKSLKLHAQKYPFKTPSSHQQSSTDAGETFHNNNNNNSTPGGSSSAPAAPSDNITSSSDVSAPPLDMSPPDPLHCLAVCRALLALLLRFDSTCGADIFLLTCKVLAKLVTSCRPAITLGQLATSHQLQLLIRRSVWTDGRRPQWAGPWAQHAATCLLQDLVETETKKELSETMSSRNDSSAEFSVRFSDSIRACHTAPLSNLDIMSLDEPEDEANGPLVGKGQLPSLIESDDSELEEFLDDVMDRGRNLLRRSEQSSRNYIIPSSSVSIALDARLEGGLDSSSELMLRRLKLSALTKSVTPSSPSSPSTNSSESPVSIGTPSSLTPEDHVQLMNWIAWPDIYSDPVPSAPTLLSPCFDALFTDLHMQTGANLEALLRLWTAINDQARCKILLNLTSLQKLVSALAWLDAIPLRAWSLGFQCLSAGVLLTDVLGGQLIPKEAAANLLDESDFRAMIVRFLSGDGDSTCQAGPTACQAMYKCLLRLKSRCEDDSHFRNAMLRVLLRLLRPGQPVALQQGPQDAQARFVHGLLHAGYERCDLATAMTVIESIGALVAAHTARCERVRCRSIADGSLSSSAFASSGFTSSSCFGSLFASVLDTGSSSNTSSQQSGSKVKNDTAIASAHGTGKNANTEALLVALLRLANRLVCTPLTSTVSTDVTI